MPEGLEFTCLNRDEHANYITGFFEGPLGDILQEEHNELIARCREAKECVVIRGEIEEDDRLDYMRDVIGIGKAFFDQGAAGILDMLTFSLYSESLCG